MDRRQSVISQMYILLIKSEIMVDYAQAVEAVKLKCVVFSLFVLKYMK